MDVPGGVALVECDGISTHLPRVAARFLGNCLLVGHLVGFVVDNMVRVIGDDETVNVAIRFSVLQRRMDAPFVNRHIGGGVQLLKEFASDSEMSLEFVYITLIDTVQ